MVKKICPVCNKEFEAISNRYIYCSVECKRDRYNKSRRTTDDNHTRTCIICGKDFIIKNHSYNAIYCSQQCKEHGQKLNQATLNHTNRSYMNHANYVSTKLVVLHDMFIPIPPKSELKKLYNKSETAIDNWFRTYINDYFDKHYKH